MRCPFIPRDLNIQDECAQLMGMTIPNDQGMDLTVEDIQELTAPPDNCLDRAVRWISGVGLYLVQGTWLEQGPNAEWFQELKESEKVQRAVQGQIETTAQCIYQVATQACPEGCDLAGRLTWLKAQTGAVQQVIGVAQTWGISPDPLYRSMLQLRRRYSALMEAEPVLEEMRGTSIYELTRRQGVLREIFLTFLCAKIGEQVERNPAIAGLTSSGFVAEFVDYLSDRVEGDDEHAWLALAEFGGRDPSACCTCRQVTCITPEDLEGLGLKTVAERRYELHTLLNGHDTRRACIAD